MNEQAKDANEIFLILKDYVDIWPATTKNHCLNNYKTLKMYAVRITSLQIPPDVVRSAMVVLCTQEAYYPSLALIVSMCYEIIKSCNGQRYVDSDEAWIEVVNAIKNRENIPSDTHIRNALEYIGGSTMIVNCNVDAVPILRAHFRDGYNNSVQREKNNKEFELAVSVLPEETRRLLLSAGKTIERGGE